MAQGVVVMNSAWQPLIYTWRNRTKTRDNILNPSSQKTISIILANAAQDKALRRRATSKTRKVDIKRKKTPKRLAAAAAIFFDLSISRDPLLFFYGDC